MRSLIIIMLSILFFACAKPGKNPIADSPKASKEVIEDHTEKEEIEYQELLKVGIGEELAKIEIKEEHLHGKFFHDRAEFYVVESPQIFIGDTEVIRLTLYFIDGVLCKKKFEIDEDISSELIKRFGGFKFLPRNLRTKEVAKSESIIIKTSEGTFINENLDRYEMKWYEDDLLIRYQLSKLPDQEIMLIEELSAYKYLLLAAEQELI